jgi:hypothetical protein
MGFTDALGAWGQLFEIVQYLVIEPSSLLGNESASIPAMVVVCDTCQFQNTKIPGLQTRRNQGRNKYGNSAGIRSDVKRP